MQLSKTNPKIISDRIADLIWFIDYFEISVFTIHTVNTIINTLIEVTLVHKSVEYTAVASPRVITRDRGFR